MKTIVTHASPDWDAITSVWLLKKFLPGWHDVTISFVPAGERYKNLALKIQNAENPIEIDGRDEIIHVDTGLGPLDHHQTSDDAVSAASRVLDYVKKQNIDLQAESEKMKFRNEALQRLVSIVVATDHFKEVFWADPAADYHEFSLLGLLEGLKLAKPDQDAYYVQFGIECLDAMLHTFENRIWAEHEVARGVQFQTKWGKGLGIETINDTVLKLAQKLEYMVVVRKDPRKGYVRIKGKPVIKDGKLTVPKEKEVDFTLVYEQLRKMDPEATWFLHVSKKMLLNGTPKNPKMRPTKLPLRDIIGVLEKV